MLKILSNLFITVIKKLKEKLAIVAFDEPISCIDLKKSFKCIEFMNMLIPIKITLKR